LTGNVVDEVDVLVLLLVVDDVVGPALVEVVVIWGSLDDVVLLVELDVLAMVVGLVLVVVVEDVLAVVLEEVVDGGLVVVLDDVVDGPLVEVVDDVLVVDAAVVVEVDEVVAAVLVVVPLVVDVVVSGPLGPQRKATCRPVVTVLAQAAPVSSVAVPIDNRASGLRIAAWMRLCAGSFTRAPPTSTVGSDVPVSGGIPKLVASPRTRSRDTAIDVGPPGDTERTTSRPVRTLQNAYAPATRTTTPASSTTRSP
jgi:hypothetical protein